MMTTENKLPAVALLLDGARGIYIPKNFIACCNLTLWEGISDENVEILKNPDHGYYWDAWAKVLDKATFTQNGNIWRLYQDGDLWALCYELMTNEERKNFGFDIENAEND